MAIDAAGRVRVVAPIALLGLLLAGCASHQQSGSDGGYPAGRGIGTYRVGGPYEIKGVWYYPAVDYNYDRTGVASWYGEQFEGRLTANGEIFDLNELTAAHTTLPMPSIVQVTNLQNGRSLELRVNDRGPFVGERLIDVSRRAAQLLGFERQGTTLVRVKVLKDESIEAANEAMRNSGQIVVASAPAAAAAVVMPAPRVEYRSPAVVPPAVRHAAARPRVTAPIEPPSPPQIAMAPRVTPPPQPPAAPPPRIASVAPSRFALISPAEAAELPPARAPTREPQFIADPKPVTRTPSSSPRIAAASSARPGQIFIQAGAFSMRINAQRVQSHIARLGSVEVTAASVNGVEMYRVRLGPLRSEKEAGQLLARVVDSGYPGARIVGD
jgi:peptidoglycan lytic transglycosylase